MAQISPNFPIFEDEKDHGQKLFADYGITPQSMIDLSTLASTMYPRKARKSSHLETLTKLYCGKSLGEVDMRKSNWEDYLSPSQQLYAANDVHSCLMIFEHLCPLAVNLGHSVNDLRTETKKICDLDSVIDWAAPYRKLPRSKPQYLRAYELWYKKGMSLDDMCTALRVKPDSDGNYSTPLKKTTRITYIVEALECNPQMPFDMKELMKLVQMETSSWERDRDKVVPMSILSEFPAILQHLAYEFFSSLKKLALKAKTDDEVQNAWNEASTILDKLEELHVAASQRVKLLETLRGRIGMAPDDTGPDNEKGMYRGYAPDDERIWDLVARLQVVLRNVRLYQRLLSCQGSEAQKLLDSFQWSTGIGQLLDTPELDLGFRRSLIVAMQRLSTKSGCYPECYELKGVAQEGQHPVAAGGFADIYKGDFQGHTVCMKVVRIYQTTDVEMFMKQVSKEVILWGQLSHPNILPIYGLYRFQSKICIVSPWMEKGDITRHLRTMPDSTFRAHLALDVALGLSYLHEKGIIHGDLKGPNILVNDEGRACLADFGISSVYFDSKIAVWKSQTSGASKGGTVRWQAPELFDIRDDNIVRNNPKTDVYACACVCYEILAGDIPFSHIPSDTAVALQIMSGARPARPANPSPWRHWGLNENIWSLIQQCWDTNPTVRPGMEEVVARLTREIRSHDKRMGSSIALPPARFRKTMSELFEVVSVEELDNILDSPSHRPEKFEASKAIPPNSSESARGLHADTSADSEATQAQQQQQRQPAKITVEYHRPSRESIEEYNALLAGADYSPIGVSPERRQPIVGLPEHAAHSPADKIARRLSPNSPGRPLKSPSPWKKNAHEEKTGEPATPRKRVPSPKEAYQRVKGLFRNHKPSTSTSTIESSSQATDSDEEEWVMPAKPVVPRGILKQPGHGDGSLGMDVARVTERLGVAEVEETSVPPPFNAADAAIMADAFRKAMRNPKWPQNSYVRERQLRGRSEVGISRFED
ncbi:hypothetical protein DXG01_006378 [Tephrocybe rancida]|nr:hypothetical protein DXG01_006378 [Tephrocybe rancida]